MCALIKSPIWGELSGKLGGNIFARNGHGSYVRQFTQPMNPNTLAQQTARNTFTQAANLFSTLESFDKTRWNEYAKTQYKPRKLSRTGKNSGYDAFMSLQQVKRMMQINGSPVTYLFDTLPHEQELSGCIINVNNIIPPKKSKSVVFKAQNNAEFTSQISLIRMSYTGALEVVFENSGNDGPVIIEENVDVNDNANGYIVYCSESHRNSGGFYKTPLSKAIMYASPWITLSGLYPPTPANTVSVSQSSLFRRSDYKEFPQVGDFVLITVYSVDCQGQMEQMGSKEIQVELFI